MPRPSSLRYAPTISPYAILLYLPTYTHRIALSVAPVYRFAMLLHLPPGAPPEVSGTDLALQHSARY
eukprot:1528049-Rhodomonas_salina.1